MTGRRPHLPVALTIAGSDSGGGAGIQADLKTFAARHVYGTSAIAALTAQNTCGVRAVRVVPAGFVRAQIDAVIEDLGVDAVKIGMLGDAATVRAVADAVEAHRIERLTVDPVMVAKGGERLLASRAVAVLRARLVPLAEVVTPNLAEATVLVGFPVVDVASMEEAAGALLRLGARAAVVTGGHLHGDAVDVLMTRRGVRVLRARRIAVAPPHGTGCTFSAAVAAERAKGVPLEAAVCTAKRYTTERIRRARRVGAGHPILV